MRRFFLTLTFLSLSAWSQPAPAMPLQPHFLPQTLVDWAQVSLVVLTALTLAVLCKYTSETIKAVKAAQDNAKAALLNAQAVINAERPWLLVSIKARISDPKAFIVQAYNAGRTPAKLHEGHCAFEKHPLNFIPTEDFRDPFLLPAQSLIVSKDSFQIFEISPGMLVEQAEREGRGLDPQPYVYGRILYWGVFTDRTAPGAKPYETRWIFRYEPLKRGFIKCAGGYAGNT